MKLDLKPLAIVVSTICIASCGSSGGSSSENSASTTTPPLVTTPDNSGGAASSKGAFIEENGVVVVELESTDYSGNWQLKSETSASGGKAIEWVGDDLFNDPTTVCPKGQASSENSCVGELP